MIGPRYRKSDGHDATVSRRDMLRFMGGAGVGLLAAEVLPPGARAALTAQSSARTTIFHWVDSGGLKSYFLKPYFASYHRKHPNVTVDYQVLPWAQIAQVIPLAVRNGNAPDVFEIPLNVTGAQAVAEGWVQPLDRYIPNFAAWKKAFPPDALLPGITEFNGKTYGFWLWSPKRYGTLTLYNVPYLHKAGYDPTRKPLTWDEFRAALQKVTQQGRGRYYGLLLGGSEAATWAAFVSNLGRMAGSPAGENINWKTGEYNFMSDGYIAAIELLLALKSDNSVYPGSLSMDSYTARARMPQGIAGIILQGPWNIPQWQKENPGFNFGVGSQPVPKHGTPVPLTVSPASGDMFWLYAKSPNGAIAGQMFSYIGSVEGQKQLLKLSGASSPVLFPEVNAMASKVAGPRAQEALNLFSKQVRLGPEPAARNTDVAKVLLEMKPIQPDFGAVVQGLYVGQLSNPKKAMKYTQDRYEAELERAIKVARSKGARVSRDDWKFANWETDKDYTADLYPKR
jgi:multiple sugar transport system substrate-binding protein